MSSVNITRIKSIVKNLIRDSRNIGLGLVVNVDRVKIYKNTIIVSGRYESLWEDGSFQVKLSRKLRVIDFKIKHK